jgi:hypothetical protein
LTSDLKEVNFYNKRNSLKVGLISSNNGEAQQQTPSISFQNVHIIKEYTLSTDVASVILNIGAGWKSGQGHFFAALPPGGRIFATL